LYSFPFSGNFTEQQPFTVRRQKRSDTWGKKLREAFGAPKLKFDYTPVIN
jgi:hypothetical protein